MFSFQTQLCWPIFYFTLPFKLSYVINSMNTSKRKENSPSFSYFHLSHIYNQLSIWHLSTLQRNSGCICKLGPFHGSMFQTLTMTQCKKYFHHNQVLVLECIFTYTSMYTYVWNRSLENHKYPYHMQCTDILCSTLFIFITKCFKTGGPNPLNGFHHLKAQSCSLKNTANWALHLLAVDGFEMPVKAMNLLSPKNTRVICT